MEASTSAFDGARRAALVERPRTPGYVAMENLAVPQTFGHGSDRYGLIAELVGETGLAAYCWLFARTRTISHSLLVSRAGRS